MISNYLLSALALAIAPVVAHADELLPVQDFVRHAEYSHAKISPDGRFLALTALQGDTTALAVVRLEDMKLIRTTRLADEKSVGSFYWVGPNRLVFTAVHNIGSYAQPFGTGEWYAMDSDGGRPRTLVAYTAQSVPSRSKVVHYSERYDLLDPLPGDETTMLMTISDRSSEVRTQVVSIDTVTGKRRVLARAPRGGACQMVLDASHTPRFANCVDDEDDGGEYGLHSELYRMDDNGTWTLVNRSQDATHQISVIGTAADGRIYATSNDHASPRIFGQLDPGTNEFKALYSDPVADPQDLIYASDGSTILGIVTMAGAPHVELIERAHPDAAVYGAVAQSFPGRLVDFSSATVDGRKIVVSVYSDSDPGQLYLYDRDQRSLRFLMRSRSWIDPAKMASVQPFSFKASDGVTLYGYLTLPRGGAKAAPTIINPHGGPIGVRDDWGFNSEAQLFASRGYLVVQLNYRGSGGYGQAFEEKGHRQWGRRMQDDLTEVTRWVAEQGYADPSRVCIYGGSYGGYASLMGVAQQPSLYKCAVGYAGVYDLPMMFEKGDIAESDSGKRYLARTLGTDQAELKRRSPTHLADRIQVPVFLAAGLRDVRAPRQQTEAMRDALEAAKNPAEVVILEPHEMHGFYNEKANLNLYTKMLAFFDRHLGAEGTEHATAATSQAANGAP